MLLSLSLASQLLKIQPKTPIAAFEALRDRSSGPQCHTSLLTVLAKNITAASGPLHLLLPRPGTFSSCPCSQLTTPLPHSGLCFNVNQSERPCLS